jgi:hypothetical protein
MGKMLKSNQQNFTGTFGNMIVYYSRGQLICRTKPDHYTDADTDLQKEVRGELIIRNEWAEKFFDDINKAIMKRGKKKLTAYNYFHHVNTPAFKTDDGTVKYELLQFSVGKLELPEIMNFTLTNRKSGTVTLNWVNGEEFKYEKPDDRLRIIAIKEDQLEIISGLTFFRKDQYATFKLPWKKWDTIYLYAFFYIESNKYSTKTYFQQIKKSDLVN